MYRRAHFTISASVYNGCALLGSRVSQTFLVSSISHVYGVGVWSRILKHPDKIQSIIVVIPNTFEFYPYLE